MPIFSVLPLLIFGYLIAPRTRTAPPENPLAFDCEHHKVTPGGLLQDQLLQAATLGLSLPIPDARPDHVLGHEIA
jgi:hypothetical protein